MVHTTPGSIVQPTDRLLSAMAEQLKLPWVQVAKIAELAQSPGDAAALDHLLNNIEITAQAALQLIDGYLLSAQSDFGQMSLELEPVSVSSAIYDVAERLDSYAKANACDLELLMQGKFAPVMANRRALETALINLGYSFIEASHSAESKHTVSFVFRRTRSGMNAGVFSTSEGLSGHLLRRARHLYGIARQPLNNFSASNGAGVFVADALITSMRSSLKTASFNKLSGLAASFDPSSQLALV